MIALAAYNLKNSVNNIVDKEVCAPILLFHKSFGLHFISLGFLCRSHSLWDSREILRSVIHKGILDFSPVVASPSSWNWARY
jgi:hypothetical protein